MVRFGICDDDREYMKSILEIIKDAFYQYNEHDEECACITYESGYQLIERINEDDIDIYFLDIECGAQSGFDIAKEIKKYRKNPGIVYMTNYSNYITQAFVCRPLGFICKTSIEIDIELPMMNICEYLEETRSGITFYNDKQTKWISVSDILSVEVFNHEMNVQMIEGKEYKFRGQLSQYEEKLIDNGFIKISRSVLVNKKYITKIKDNEMYVGNKLSYEISRRRIGQIQGLIGGRR